MRTLRAESSAAFLGLALLALWASSVAADTRPAAKPKPTPYPLESCIVSGERLGEMGDPIVRVYDGREMKFCCGGCVGKFEANRASYLAQIDSMLIAQQRPIYPLDTCVVNGTSLDTADGPVEFLVANRLVRTCSTECRAVVEQDPAGYLAKLDAAVIAQQLPSYPLDTCPVLGGKLGGMGEPVNYVYQGRLVRFCCAGCIAMFEANPFIYLAKIDRAAKSAQKAAQPE
jgi:YHS domain-containing protein